MQSIKASRRWCSWEDLKSHNSCPSSSLWNILIIQPSSTLASKNDLNAIHWDYKDGNFPLQHFKFFNIYCHFCRVLLLVIIIHQSLRQYLAPLVMILCNLHMSVSVSFHNVDSHSTGQPLQQEPGVSKKPKASSRFDKGCQRHQLNSNFWS